MKVLDPILWSNHNYSTPLQPNHRRHTFTTAAAVCLGCGLSLNSGVKQASYIRLIWVTCTIEMFVKTPGRGNCPGETAPHLPQALLAPVSGCCARWLPLLVRWSREHGMTALMGSALLQPCRPSVKMLRCCDGAAGANGRNMGVGCCTGAGCIVGSAAGGCCCGAGVGCTCQVSSQTRKDELGYCGACNREGSTTLGLAPSWGSMLRTLCGELDRARATAGVTSCRMGSARWPEKSFQGSCSSCCSGGGGALAGGAVAGVCAAPARQAGGAFRGVAAGPVVGRLSSSESGGSGGGALRPENPKALK